MKTPRRHTDGSQQAHQIGEEFGSPLPPECCQGRLFLIEYSILFGLQLLCFIVDIGIWVVSAYSIIAAFCLIFVLHCLILLPAIFLPLIFKKCGLWLKRLRDWKVFHKYDWNIAVSTVTIVSTVVSVLLVLFCQPVYFKWTHDTVKVGLQPSYAKMSQYSSFKFTETYLVNVTMMGEKISYPIGDPNGAGVYYNCFAPVLVNGTLGPNMFWAVCPWQKGPCAASLGERNTCVEKWLSDFREGNLWARDVSYLLNDAIKEQTAIWKLHSPPPGRFLVLRWDNAKRAYDNAFSAWWGSLLGGNLLILLWWIIRRPFLRCFCTPQNGPDYSHVN